MKILKEYPINYRDTLSKEEIAYYTSSIENYVTNFVAKEFPQLLDVVKTKLDFEVSNRYTRKFGNFQSKRYVSGGEPFDLKITASGKGIKASVEAGMYEDFLQEVILHETIHFVCLMLNKPFEDGDPYFEKMLFRYGSASSWKTNDSKTVADRAHLPSFLYKHECKCRTSYNRTKLGEDWYCKKCKGSFKVISKCLVISD